MQSGGYSPVGGTTFFPQNQPSAYTTHVSNPPPPPNNADNNASTAEDLVDEQRKEKERETPSWAQTSVKVYCLLEYAPMCSCP